MRFRSGFCAALFVILSLTNVTAVPSGETAPPPKPAPSPAKPAPVPAKPAAAKTATAPAKPVAAPAKGAAAKAAPAKKAPPPADTAPHPGELEPNTPKFTQSGILSSWFFYEDFGNDPVTGKNTYQNAGIVRYSPDVSLQWEKTRIVAEFDLTMVMGRSADYPKQDAYGVPRLDLRNAYVSLNPVPPLTWDIGIYPTKAPGMLTRSGSVGGAKLTWNAKPKTAVYAEVFKTTEAYSLSPAPVFNDRSGFTLGAALDFTRVGIFPEVLLLSEQDPDMYAVIPQLRALASIPVGTKTLTVDGAGGWAYGNQDGVTSGALSAAIGAYAFKADASLDVAQGLAAGLFVLNASSASTDARKLSGWGEIAQSPRYQETEMVLQGEWDGIWCPYLGTTYSGTLVRNGGILSFGGSGSYDRKGVSVKLIGAMHLSARHPDESYGMEGNLLAAYRLEKNVDLIGQAMVFASGNYFARTSVMPALALGITARW